jgi:hypothetical protein
MKGSTSGSNPKKCGAEKLEYRREGKRNGGGDYIFAQKIVYCHTPYLLEPIIFRW